MTIFLKNKYSEPKKIDNNLSNKKTCMNIRKVIILIIILILSIVFLYFTFVKKSENKSSYFKYLDIKYTYSSGPIITTENGDYSVIFRKNGKYEYFCSKEDNELNEYAGDYGKYVYNSDDETLSTSIGDNLKILYMSKDYFGLLKDNRVLRFERSELIKNNNHKLQYREIKDEDTYGIYEKVYEKDGKNYSEKVYITENTVLTTGGYVDDTKNLSPIILKFGYINNNTFRDSIEELHYYKGNYMEYSFVNTTIKYDYDDRYIEIFEKTDTEDKWKIYYTYDKKARTLLGYKKIGEKDQAKKYLKKYNDDFVSNFAHINGAYMVFRFVNKNLENFYIKDDTKEVYIYDNNKVVLYTDGEIKLGLITIGDIKQHYQNLNKVIFFDIHDLLIKQATFDVGGECIFYDSFVWVKKDKSMLSHINTNDYN